jgi:uncharacterized membrane protein (UPF0182 family)
VLLILIAILVSFINGWSDYMWFASHNYASVFWTLLLTQYGVGLPVFLVAFLFFLLNFWCLRRNLPRLGLLGQDNQVIDLVQNPLRKLAASWVGIGLMFVLSAVLALMMAVQAGSQWELVQRFLHATPFGQTDPVFGLDIGFYIFKLPFYELIQSLLAAALWLALIFSGAAYFFLFNREFVQGGWRRYSPVKLHLALLVAGLLVTQAWIYWLRTYLLLFNQHQSYWGAGYTDLIVMLPVLKIMTVLALAAAAMVFIGIVRGRLRPIATGLGALIVASLLLSVIYPALVQSFSVKPNEFDREQPYIERNLIATRAAYGLDKIQPLTSLEGTSNMQPGQVDQAVLDQYNTTLINLRLWDPRPLMQVYTQLQQLRQYYSFPDVDIDRYRLGSGYRQVMLSVRELDQSKLPDEAQTWVNTRLQYTHGYGLVMSPANEIDPTGLPNYMISNIPPQSTDPVLNITQPGIYYGQLTVNPVIAGSKAGGTGEFDYPSGGTNVYTSYRGTGGVALNNWWRRLAYAVRFSDLQMLLSGDITPNSRILYYRTVQDVQRLAPYLQYDADPYPVVSGGRIYWIWDAYTTSDHYPYSAMNGQYNYIRNSVKVVIDAYNGTTTFYVSDPSDPIVQTYSKIFPGLYRPLTSMPAGLRAHIRYPVDFFNAQATIYANYHVTDPRVFYNQEDVWSYPNEKYSGTSQRMDPYYAIMKLPGGTQEEFVLVLPFTLFSREDNNLVGWLAARCDGDHYGQLVVYDFPKDTNTYGPMQVEASIDQDADISSQITLWDQHGSTVIRGNLITVPLAGKLLYVEPLFLQADQSSLPELKRVIVFYEGKAVMATTFGDALNQLFGLSGAPQSVSPGPAQSAAPGGAAEGMQSLVSQANELYASAQNSLKNGDWTGYGKAIGDLGQVLQQMTSPSGNAAS